jgi:ABC-2 type transport system ATP-binding protein
MEVIAKGATKTIGDKNILDGINLHIQTGSVYGLIGPNGAGKTSFIRTLLNIYNLTSGDIIVGGVSVKNSGFYKTKSQIGCVLDFLGLYKDLTAWANIEFFHRLFFPKASQTTRSEDITKALNMVGLLSKKDEKITFFSKGQKQRLAIARAVINKPKLLILDEPTSGLDVESIILLREYIKDLQNQGATVLISSHHLSELEKTCTHVGFINEGKIVKESAIDDLEGERKEGVLENAYKTIFKLS